jgi:hypothetical protein
MMAMNDMTELATRWMPCFSNCILATTTDAKLFGVVFQYRTDVTSIDQPCGRYAPTMLSTASSMQQTV